MRSMWGIMPAFLVQGAKIHLEKEYKKLKEFFRKLANEGGFFWRSLVYYPQLPPLKAIHNGILIPFIFENGKFDLEKFNNEYFLYFEELVKLSKQYNLIPIISIMDFAQTRHPNQFKNAFINPHLNKQNVTILSGTKYWKKLARKITKILYKIMGNNFIIEICNEPQYPDQQRIGKWQSEIYEAIKNYNIMIYGGTEHVNMIDALCNTIKSKKEIVSFHLAENDGIEKILEIIYSLKLNNISISTDGMWPDVVDEDLYELALSLIHI